MFAPLAYLNGRFLPFAEAGLALHDAGFVSGATIVDNARTFGHKLFRWADHLTRFRRDCEECYIPLERSDVEITAAAEELIAHNAKLLPPGGELQLVTFATPGPLGFYLGGQENGPATLGMATYPLPFSRYRSFFTEGVTLAFAGFQASDSADILSPTVKHRSRLFWHIAERLVRDPSEPTYHPKAVPVVMNLHGVGDTAIGSILVVSGNTVIAADYGSVQNSISTRVVEELCRTCGLEFHTAPLDMRFLARESDSRLGLGPVSELLLAGSGFCLASVREFVSLQQSRTYSWPGPVFQRLLAAWNELVGVDIAEQMTHQSL